MPEAASKRVLADARAVPANASCDGQAATSCAQGPCVSRRSERRDLITSGQIDQRGDHFRPLRKVPGERRDGLYNRGRSAALISNRDRNRSSLKRARTATGVPQNQYRCAVEDVDGKVELIVSALGKSRLVRRGRSRVHRRTASRVAADCGWVLVDESIDAHGHCERNEAENDCPGGQSPVSRDHPRLASDHVRQRRSSH